MATGGSWPFQQIDVLQQHIQVTDVTRAGTVSDGVMSGCWRPAEVRLSVWVVEVDWLTPATLYQLQYSGCDANYGAAKGSLSTMHKW